MADFEIAWGETEINEGGYVNDLLNRNQKNYPDIVVDGKFGGETMVAMKAFLKLEKGQPDYLLKILVLMQGAFYIEIMRKKPNQQKFARGWLNRVGSR